MEPHYSPTAPSVQSDNRRLRCILAKCVRTASLHGRRLWITVPLPLPKAVDENAEDLMRTVNAFLTLTDVTKWWGAAPVGDG